MERGFADFIQRALHNAISAETALQTAGCRATVAIARIVIVALFRRFQHPIPAQMHKGIDLRFDRARCGATITGNDVAIITRLGGGNRAVTTESCSCHQDRFADAGIGAAISRAKIAIITLLARVGDSVAADNHACNKYLASTE
ncbi:hypothetical protein A3B61_03305 [Candidatus Peribacteria bacterium RIFCSPLOWO2_01_FULL_53_10]|nr:MAG: hypothetical protein A3B61_03305 [Candidatus Peribacteria bacterium RIFCSPLOWO2_01_FULL_53_10]